MYTCISIALNIHKSIERYMHTHTYIYIYIYIYIPWKCVLIGNGRRVNRHAGVGGNNPKMAVALLSLASGVDRAISIEGVAISFGCFKPGSNKWDFELYMSMYILTYMCIYVYIHIYSIHTHSCMSYKI
jgi:hypothetical protein